MRYDAFISYRHAKLDMYVAKKIHKGLETFRVPRAVTKKSGKKEHQAGISGSGGASDWQRFRRQYQKGISRV